MCVYFHLKEMKEKVGDAFLLYYASYMTQLELNSIVLTV